MTGVQTCALPIYDHDHLYEIENRHREHAAECGVGEDDGCAQDHAHFLGTAIVLTYTTFGGMFSVAILDFVQMAVVMGGMLFIGYLVSGMTGGVETVISQASAAGKLDFFPAGNWAEWLAFIAAWMTMMLGPIPQQDVFQRVTSAKSARVAI